MRTLCTLFLLTGVLAGPIAAQIPETERSLESTGERLLEAVYEGEPNRVGPSLDRAMRQAAGESERRPPWVPMLLSAGVPGAGQIYNDDWIKAGLAIGLEAAAWTGWAVWRNRGREGRRAYRAYAHAHFSPLRYARWLDQYPGYEGEGLALERYEGAVDFGDPDAWSREERRLVEDLIDAIQRAENQSHFAGNPSASFSHQLPQFGEQQYYELIGKYHQYAPGWDDCGSGCDEDDPSERFLEYARKHGRANTQLRRASRMTALVLVNHGLAALDGLLSAQLHNSRLETRARLHPGRRGALRARLAVRYRW